MKLLKLIPDNTNLNFMRWRNLALVLSILATVASLTLVGVRGLNLGVDFIGGQMIRATFQQKVDVEQLRSDVGRLELGEASIAIAVSSPHRGDAFAAGQWLIDTIKEVVPIWKQENWADGTSEWVHPNLDLK